MLLSSVEEILETTPSERAFDTELRLSRTSSFSLRLLLLERTTIL